MDGRDKDNMGGGPVGRSAPPWVGRQQPEAAGGGSLLDAEEDCEDLG